MLYFVLFVVIPIIICIILFGNTDDKKSLLNSVGLDYRNDVYETSKEKEFKNKVKKIIEELEKQAKKEMPNASDFELLEKMWYIIRNEHEQLLERTGYISKESDRVWWILSRSYEKQLSIRNSKEM